MSSGRVRRISVAFGVAVALVLLAAGGAAGQTGVDPLARVRDGQHVWVTTVDGRQLEGRVVGVAPGGLDVSSEGLRRALPLGEIRRIETRDSLKNGAITGGIVGGAAMVCVVTWAIQLADEGQGVSRRDILTAIRLTALAAAGGALAGAGIDRAIDGRRTLYDASGGSGVRVRPVAGPGGLGVSVRAGW